MLILLAMLVMQPTWCQPASHHFRLSTVAPPIQLGPQVLAGEDRAYLASLPEIRVAIATPPASPYETVADDGEVGGIHSEILAYLARAFGLRVRPVVFPSWTSALEAMRHHDADLIMTVGVTNDRTQFLEFTLGVTPWPGALFARAAAPSRPLENASFAIERDYLANDFIRRQYPRATILTVANTGEALAAVADARADYYLGALFEALDWGGRPSVQGVEVRQLMSYGTGYYHFAVRKDWARLALILNRGISTLREAPLPQWQAAIKSLPPHVTMPRPLGLSGEEEALLIGHPTWRFGAVRGLALLNDVDRDGLHSGIAAEYAEQVARRLGIGLQVVPYDSVAAMLDGLRSGEIDLVPFLSRTPKRDEEFVFSTSYVEMPYLLVARTDGPYFWDLNSLHGRKLALAAQHPLREVLVREYPAIQVVDARDGNEAMDAVARGDADAAVEVKLFANLRINSDSGNRLRAVAAVNALPAQFHFAASQRTRAMIPMVNRVLAEVSPADRDRMLRRWIAVDLDPPFPWRRNLPVIAVGMAGLLSLALLTWWWMRRLSREVADRRISEERLQDIGNTLPCVAFRQTVNERAELLSTYFSPGSQAFLGIPLQGSKTLLENLAPYMGDECRQDAEQAVRHCLQSGEPFKLTCSYRPPGHQLRWLHCEAVRRPASGGKATWTGYVVDVTTERDLQARLADEARKRNLMLASASHELRAPAHTAALALEALGEGTPEARSRALVVARDAMHTLTQLLGDVLDAAQLNHGELRLAPQVFDLTSWIGLLADSARHGAEHKGLNFELTVERALPTVVMMDPLRMRQVVMNLLSNAIKYTDKGFVRLHVATVADERGSRSLLVTVVDSGRGIPADKLGRVFIPFVGADAQQVVPEGSTGLGLSICRRLATLMGGRVELRSEPGHGTTALFEVPMRLVANGPVKPHPPTVLVCDDDDVSRLLMTQMLAGHGYEVSQASGGAEALQRLREGGIGLLITDLRMSGMSGAELLYAVADFEAEGIQRPTIVVCSGDAAPGEGESRLFDAFVGKPLQMQVLLDTLTAVGFPGPEHRAITS